MTTLDGGMLVMWEVFMCGDKMYIRTLLLNFAVNLKLLLNTYICEKTMASILGALFCSLICHVVSSLMERPMWHPWCLQPAKTRGLQWPPEWARSGYSPHEPWDDCSHNGHLDYNLIRHISRDFEGKEPR